MNPDEAGKFSGDNIAFIYPDLRTALVGKFVDGVMDGAREATVDQVVNVIKLFSFIADEKA